jgi:hypothetical protein
MFDGHKLKTVSEEEERKRLDIYYRRSGAVHIVLELKRYNPSNKPTTIGLLEQVNGYMTTLRKYLQEDAEEPNPQIFGVCIVGELPNDYNEPMGGTGLRKGPATETNFSARIITWEKLILDSRKRFDDFLKQNAKVTRLQEVVEAIDNEIHSD